MKVVVVFAVILFAGYLVLAFSASTARLATGEIWRRAPLWTVLRQREVATRAALLTQVSDPTKTQAERDELRYDIEAPNVQRPAIALPAQLFAALHTAQDERERFAAAA